jgi:hypothetical protein
MIACPGGATPVCEGGMWGCPSLPTMDGGGGGADAEPGCSSPPMLACPGGAAPECEMGVWECPALPMGDAG